MATLFISHASDDKGRIEPIVLRLLDRLSAFGHQLWIDKPERVSNDPRLQSAGAIQYGSSWSQAIAQALADKRCLVLMVWSANVARKIGAQPASKIGSLAWEMQQAIENGAFVGARLEGVSQDLPESARKLHWCDLRDWRPETYHGEFEKLLAFILGRLAELDRITDRSADDHVRRLTRSRTPTVERELVLQYVDRGKQEIGARAAARHVMDGKGPHPIAVIGPEDEEPQLFLKRLFRAASELFGEGGALQMRVDWPRDHDFFETYRALVSLELAQHADLTIDEISERLSRQPHLIVFWSLLSSERWSGVERARLVQWARFWRQVGEARHSNVRALPIVCIKLPAIERAWFDPQRKDSIPPRPNGAHGPSPRQIWDEIGAVGATQGIALERLAMLAPILRDEADAWLTRPDVALDGTDPRARQAQATLRNLFGAAKSGGLFKKLPPQIAIRNFSSAMHPYVSAEPRDEGRKA